MTNPVKLLVASTILATCLTPGFSQEKRATASTSPRTLNEVGNVDVVYQPTRWPMFGASSSDNEPCANALRAMSGKYKHDTHPAYNPLPAPATIISKEIIFSNLGLTRYRKTAKLLISWTIRVEAYQQMINPWQNVPRLCHPWHGTIAENFPGGEVETMLYINGKPLGNKAVMSIPPLGSNINSNPSDPTITNSFTLSTKDFPGGEFPDKLMLEVKWVNKTIGSSIKSPANMRNMTIFILPV